MDTSSESTAATNSTSTKGLELEGPPPTITFGDPQ
jgi:hypothetical protein